MALSPTSSRGGGGGTPAGDDTEIQFNDDGAFGASPDFVVQELSGDAQLRLQATQDGIATIIGNAPGVQVFIAGAYGADTTVGGELTLRSGGSIGNNGGDVNLTAGNDESDGDGGNVAVKAGNSVTGSGGAVSVRGGNGAGGGGQVIVQGGTGAGGNVIVGGGGSTHNVQMYSGDGNQYVQLDNDGLQIGATKLGFFQGATVVQPTGVAVTAAAIHAALVSLGLITA
jgi:hypothetical protein